jgi:hypothetical protein
MNGQIRGQSSSVASRISMRPSLVAQPADRQRTR